MRPHTPARAMRSMQRCMRQIPQTQRSTLSPTPRISSTTTTPTRAFTTTQSRPHNPSASTVDPTEVSHFNALASSWWDPHGSSRLLHLMNPLRHDFISSCRFNDPITAGQKLRYLDIGCGGGIFAESAARLPDTHSVTAIDPTPGVLKIAEAHKRRDPALMQPGKLTYLNTSIEDLALPKTPEEGYDIVSLFEVLEHVNAPGPFISKLLPHVKPGGWLVMSTIARTWTSWLVTNVMAEDVLGIVPKGTHEWAKYVNEDELRGYFAKEPGWDGASARSLGVMYVPGFGWKEVRGGEDWGNYFFAVKRLG